MATATAPVLSEAPLYVVAMAARDRTRALVRGAVPRRRGRVAVARSSAEFQAPFRRAIVDAAVVDLGSPPAMLEVAFRLARDFPSVAFVGIASYRNADTPLIARCAGLDFVDVVAEGVDEGALRPLVETHAYSTRFARMLHDPPRALALTSRLQLAAWRYIVGHAGRALATTALARALGVTREHLSRAFAIGAAPTLKRAIDLVRLLAAAELSKNPGLDSADVATALGFTSPSHLSAAATRVAGTRIGSLSALRGVDIIERFARGRGAGG